MILLLRFKNISGIINNIYDWTYNQQTIIWKIFKSESHCNSSLCGLVPLLSYRYTSNSEILGTHIEEFASIKGIPIIEIDLE